MLAYLQLVVLSWPVEPMVARTVAAIPEGDGWSYEPKFDGFRCLTLIAGADRVRLQSRQQRSLTHAFPEVVAALGGHLPAGTVVDGELVVMAEGRVSFEALQRRMTARRAADPPATLVAFDLLAHNDHDLRPLPYTERRRRLELLLGAAPPNLALSPATTNIAGARAWLAHGDRGIEGVVAKRLDHPYAPRRRHWAKIRARETIEAVVGGVTGSLTAPTGLILGRHDDQGRLRVIGRTTVLNRTITRELADAFPTPRAPHPWPDVLAGGRFGLPGSDPVEYIPVDPVVVVEIEADFSFELGRYRHGVRYLRMRPDLEPEDV